MSTAINTIQAANNGITSITKLVQSAQALVSQAQQTSDTTVRAGLATQFNAIRTQIDQLAGDSGFNGINLLDSTNSTNLTVDAERNRHFERHRHRRRLHHRRRPAINNAANNWAGAADITRGQHRPDRRVDHAAFAVPGVRLEPVDRADPPGLHQGDDQHAADRLGQPHARRLNEEGANLLALQTRQQLSTTALSLASQASQAVLRLFQLSPKQASTSETAARKCRRFSFAPHPAPATAHFVTIK